MNNRGKWSRPVDRPEARASRSEPSIRNVSRGRASAIETTQGSSRSPANQVARSRPSMVRTSLLEPFQGSNASRSMRFGQGDLFGAIKTGDRFSPRAESIKIPRRRASGEVDDSSGLEWNLDGRDDVPVRGGLLVTRMHLEAPRDKIAAPWSHGPLRELKGYGLALRDNIARPSWPAPRSIARHWLFAMTNWSARSKSSL